MPLPIRKLISLPPAAARDFSAAYPRLASQWLATCDPPGARLGSGGGLAHLLIEGWRSEHPGAEPTRDELRDWLSKGHILTVLAGGHSRRLPAFAATGKALIPVPPVPGQRGAPIDQVLLDLLEQPLLAPLVQTGDPRVLVVTGDVVLIVQSQLPPLSGADAVFLGCPAPPEVLTRFGVFVIEEERLQAFLQKPSLATLTALPPTSRCLLDVGAWSFSTDAIMVLLDRALAAKDQPFELYSEFGDDLVSSRLHNDENRKITSAVLDWPLQFHHLGSTPEFLDSMSAVLEKPVMGWVQGGPSANSATVVTGTLPPLSGTGVPDNCGLDLVPLKDGKWAARFYGFSDSFSGSLANATLLNRPASEWFEARKLDLPQGDDIQFEPIYPVYATKPQTTDLLWLFDPSVPCNEQALPYRLSAFELGTHADVQQIAAIQSEIWKSRVSQEALSDPSDLLRYDLSALAEVLSEFHADPALTGLEAVHASMLESAVHRSEAAEQRAFRALHELILADTRLTPQNPQWIHSVSAKVISTAPARWDLAGGWSDTPPYPLVFGGEVVNIGVEINGAPPIQVHLRRLEEPVILLHSVDQSIQARVEHAQELTASGNLEEAFGIAKAAIQLSGFSEHRPESLSDQLIQAGGGFALTVSSALPRGSGLGASSILGAAVLATLSTGFGLGWDQDEIALRTLALEQLLTSGGGWQDQIGGIYPGVKIAVSEPGAEQKIQVYGLPETLFQEPSFRARILLFNTGITRVAKSVLGEIVRGLFLNSRATLDAVGQIKANARVCARAIEDCDPEAFCAAIRNSWRLNCLLDSGTCPEPVAAIEARVAPFASAYKLLGAGGGGFFLIIAKSAEDAERIRADLTTTPPNLNSGFVEWSVSREGLRTWVE